MNIESHNPYCRLVGQLVFLDGKYIELVYGIENDGTNEGLEAYFYNVDDYSEGHYRSYRWLDDRIPKKYINQYEKLKSHVNEVPEGHKLTLQ